MAKQKKPKFNINLSLIPEGLKVSISDTKTGKLLETSILTDKGQLAQFGKDILESIPMQEPEQHADGFKPKSGSDIHDVI